MKERGVPSYVNQQTHGLKRSSIKRQIMKTTPGMPARLPIGCLQNFRKQIRKAGSVIRLARQAKGPVSCTSCQIKLYLLIIRLTQSSLF
jgi:hypothetical protein